MNDEIVASGSCGNCVNYLHENCTVRGCCCGCSEWNEGG